jgi:hypothetical protein
MMIGTATLGIQVWLSAGLLGRALAQSPTLMPGSTPVGGCNFNTGELDSTCLPNYIAYLIGEIFTLTGAIFLLMIIIGGYQYVISKAGGGGGDEGKARVRFAIIGFLVTALSFYIVDFILNSLIP